MTNFFRTLLETLKEILHKEPIVRVRRLNLEELAKREEIFRKPIVLFKIIELKLLVDVVQISQIQDIFVILILVAILAVLFLLCECLV